MESTRRPFDRSLSRDPGPKKPRLIEDPATSDRISNGRAGFVQRPAVSNSGGGGSRAQRGRDSDSSDSARGPYQHRPGQQLHLELVTQYKTALAELTFNSKPIITNLTIIAGENLHAAKAVAATVCSNILEVPSEQKLPSLYLLDSIVKNIGREYIKYFASRLPEVFCKAYRQVDLSIHPGMRHLFGTWKGVFPMHTLQMIEKELGFASTVNVSSSGISSRPDSQAQRPAHSIHVNPKYLEARQRLQTDRARGAGSDTSGAVVKSHEDIETLERTASISSGRSLADPYVKHSIQHHHRDKVNYAVRDKSSNVAYADSEYGSSVSGHSFSGTGKLIEKLDKLQYDRPWHESGSDMNRMAEKRNDFGVKHGFESYDAHDSANFNSDMRLKRTIGNRRTNDMSVNWKDSEEEEYMWDEINTKPTVRSADNASAKGHWAPDNYNRLDFEGYLQKPQSINDNGSRDEDEASADSISMDPGQVASGTEELSWSEKLHPQGRMLLGASKGISGCSEAYPRGLRSSQSTQGRTPSQSQLSSAHIGVPGIKSSTNEMPGPKVSLTQQRQTLGVASSSVRALLHQRTPSPSLSSHNPNQLESNFAEHSQTSIRHPTDPRKPPGHNRYNDQFSGDSLPLASQDVYQARTQRLQPQNLRSSTTPMLPVQHSKHATSGQPRNLEVYEVESSGQGQNLVMARVSGSESRSSMGNSSSDQSNPLNIDSPGQSITSTLLDAVTKGGIPSSSSLMGSLTKPCSQEAKPGSSPGVMQPPLPSVPLANISSSNHVSSILSSLVAKGLISNSKSDTLLSSPPNIPDQHLESDSGTASTSSTPISSIPVTISKSPVSVTDEPSSFKPTAKDSDGWLQSTAKIEHLIGFEFRPDVIRKFHSHVISNVMSDLPYRCHTCGLGLKFQVQLDRHMQWHASQVSNQNPSSKTSRSWYAYSIDWVAGIGDFHLGDSPSDRGSGETLEGSEPIVPADESQCACMLCGEMFEDHYSLERDEWMFKGAVYLTNPSLESDGGLGTMSDTAITIVHADCISEESVCSLGLA